MIVGAYTVAAILFRVGVYLIATDLTERFMPYQPIADQAQHWLDERARARSRSPGT
jgi:hypothetical protein